MHTSSTLQTCAYFNITLCMPWIWAPLWFLCSTNEISFAQTTLAIPVVYIRGRVACWEVTWPNDDIHTRRFQYTGTPLGILHWNHTGWGYRPVVFQWQSSVNFHNWNILDHHWKTTERSLEAHWKHTSYQQFFLQWHSSVYLGLSSRYTELPLDCHRITTGSE